MLHTSPPFCSLARIMRHSALSLALAGFACGQDGSHPVADLIAGDAPSQSQALQAEACDFAGVWALKFEIPVSWPANAGITSGQGVIEQWALSERRMVSGTEIEETFHPCGSAVPTYQALWGYGGERYGVGFADSLFDSGILPALMGRTEVTDLKPGATFSSDNLAIALGAHLPSPQTDPWPRRTSDLTPYLDDSDADGDPGVTVYARDDGDLQLPPVNPFKTRRASHFFLALRNVMGAHGKVVSCDRFEGSTLIPMMQGKPAIASTIVGCRLTDGSLCTKGHATLANTFQPAYHLDAGSRSVMVRVDHATTCAQVRAMNF
jgi:hypothetical protein